MPNRKSNWSNDDYYKDYILNIAYIAEEYRVTTAHVQDIYLSKIDNSYIGCSSDDTFVSYFIDIICLMELTEVQNNKNNPKYKANLSLDSTRGVWFAFNHNDKEIKMFGGLWTNGKPLAIDYLNTLPDIDRPYY